MFIVCIDYGIPSEYLIGICIGKEASSHLYCTNEINDTDLELLFTMNNSEIINIFVCIFCRLLIMLFN